MCAVALPAGLDRYESGAVRKIKSRTADTSLVLFTLLIISLFSIFIAAASPQEGSSPTAPEQLDIPFLQKQAVGGDATAAYLLGRSYMTGSGVPKNDTQAAKWFLQSAGQGLADAEFALAYLYEHGQGVPRDYKRASSYYEAAAKQGHGAAQNNLASMYEHGEGLAKNIQEAGRWYQSAASHGNRVAECNFASLLFRQRKFPQALTWFRAAARAGETSAEEDLAWMYYTGTGTARDYGESAKWVRLAAEQGDARAQLDLAYLYEQGKGVPLDYIAAYDWYKAAAAGGEKRASTKLRNMTHLMTPEQISKADAFAAQMPKSHPAVGSEEPQPIGSAFVDSR